MDDQLRVLLGQSRSLSPAELQAKLDRLEANKQNLVEEKCSLQNQIEDLRALIARVVKEGEINRKRHGQVRAELETDIKRTEAALAVIRARGGEFEQAAELWADLEM